MLYLFNKNEVLLHELERPQLESMVQSDELNGTMTLDFSVYLDYKDRMEGVEYVGHKVPDRENHIQLYKILNSETGPLSIKYQAVHVLFDDLKAKGYIREKRPKGVKPTVALALILEGTGREVGPCDDAKAQSFFFYDMTKLEALSKIISTYGLELTYYIEFIGNKITHKVISLKGRLGTDTGERFVYGSNALEVVATVDRADIVTRLIPRGKGLEIDHQEEDKEKIEKEREVEREYRANGYTRRIQITDLVRSKPKGDPLDKPKGQEYLELPEATRIYGYPDGSPRTKVVVFEDIDDPQALALAGYKALVKYSRPLAQFKTTVRKEGRAALGDIVSIVRHDIDIYYKTRVYKIKRDYLSGGVEVEFGDRILESQSQRDKKLLDSLNKLSGDLGLEKLNTKSYIEQVQDQLTEVMFNEEGYNYDLKIDNKYKLPAGFYSFNKPIDQNPTKVIYVGAGKFAIANSKNSDGSRKWRTFGDGDGFTADLIRVGILRGGKVFWNLEDGTFIIGSSANDYSLFRDGSTLHLRNVDLDLENNDTIKGLRESIQVTDGKIVSTVAASESKLAGQIEGVQADVNAVRQESQSQIKQTKDEITTTVSAQGKKLQDQITETNGNVAYLDGKAQARYEDTQTQIKQTQNSITSTVTATETKLQDQINTNMVDIFNTGNKIEDTKYELQSKISQNAYGITTKVSKDGVISSINQSAEGVKIKASRVDLTGNLNLTGRFKTYFPDSQGGNAIDIRGSSIDFYSYLDRNALAGYLGNNKVVNTYINTITLGHYKDALMRLSYHDERANLWVGYISFDHRDIEGNNNGYEITTMRTARFADKVKFSSSTSFTGEATFSNHLKFNLVQIRQYNNAFEIMTYDGKNGITIWEDHVSVTSNGKTTRL